MFFMECEDRIPYFIQVRGCINCEASKRYREKYGKDYGFDHEIVAMCVLMGCVGYSHDLLNPFLDAEEVFRITVERKGELTPKQLENVRKYLLGIKEYFGEFYGRIGVSIDDLIGQLE